MSLIPRRNLSHFVALCIVLSVLLLATTAIQVIHGGARSGENSALWSAIFTGVAVSGLIYSRRGIFRQEWLPIAQAALFGVAALAMGTWAALWGSMSANHVPILFAIILIPASIYFLYMTIRAALHYYRSQP